MAPEGCSSAHAYHDRGVSLHHVPVAQQAHGQLTVLTGCEGHIPTADGFDGRPVVRCKGGNFGWPNVGEMSELSATTPEG